MENNEQIEETQDTSTEDVNNETNEGGEDTKDWKAEALKYKAIAERKDKKLQASETSEENNKPKTEQTGLSREEAIFYAKGGEEEDLKVAQKVAALEGISLLAAIEDPYYKQKVEERKAEAKIKANSIGSSNGTAPPAREKDINSLTPEEHKDYAAKKYGIR